MRGAVMCGIGVAILAASFAVIVQAHARAHAPRAAEPARFVHGGQTLAVPCGDGTVFVSLGGID